MKKKNPETLDENQVEQRELPPLPVLSKDPLTALDQLKTALIELCAYYERENKILSKSKSQDFTEMQDEKMILARNYQSIMGQIAARRDELKQAPKELRDEIKKIHAQFLELAKENRTALERLQNATKRISERMINTVKEELEKRRVHNYAHNGTVSVERKSPLSASLSETA